MAQEGFNIREKPKDSQARKIAVYTVCVLVLILSVLLDIYFIGELIA